MAAERRAASYTVVGFQVILKLNSKRNGQVKAARQKLLCLAALALALGGCASQVSKPVDWRGKTVGVAEYPIGEFNLIKGTFDVANPTNISAEYGIDDPAVWVRDELLKTIVGRCGATVSPVRIPTDIFSNGVTSKRIYEATDRRALAAGIDVLLRVRWEGAYAGLFHRAVITEMPGSVTDLRVGRRRVLYCRQDSNEGKLTVDDLLADRGARLKKVLDRQRQACLREFEAQLPVCVQPMSPAAVTH
jgi:hypothetical protein